MKLFRIITHEWWNWTSLAVGSQFDIMHDMRNAQTALKERGETIFKSINVFATINLNIDKTVNMNKKGQIRHKFSNCD